MSAQLPVLRYTEGDTLPLLRVVARRADGTAPNYALYAIKLMLARDADEPLEKTASLVDAETGEFLFTWDEDDLVRGKHLATVVMLDPDGNKLTLRRVLFDVEAPIE